MVVTISDIQCTPIARMKDEHRVGDAKKGHYHIVRLIIHSKRKAEQFGLLNFIIRLVMNNKANNGNYLPSYG